MFKFFISFFLVLLAFSAVLGDKSAVITCFGDCIKVDEPEQVKECTQKCVGGPIDDASRAFLECESKCVDLWFRPEYDNTKVPELLKCNSECADEYTKAA
ncbi:Protein CBG00812 [Caenorhabditis briggsae]|uniref:Uncharacterized protein n=2 Tax=Caenorhabditis briggsae TaxID=6238 RepID=A0AAE9JJ24_CAEBR|nr:Protein CBG00812 [Caenorhabditis briggsae]ULT86428.1 hypothetical protein L3Y34_006254 [Caenorhabditis briggsae]UMM32184.1 hypothetical protein L5515_006078 [Caenorhabditis briggsae]CAP22169.1 Protein CBG00812 [Caenorhabditis briggsae]